MQISEEWMRTDVCKYLNDDDKRLLQVTQQSEVESKGLITIIYLLSPFRT